MPEPQSSNSKLKFRVWMLIWGLDIGIWDLFNLITTFPPAASMTRRLAFMRGDRQRHEYQSEHPENERLDESHEHLQEHER